MGLLDRFEDVADKLFGNPAEQAVASRIITNEVVRGAGKKTYRDLGEPEPGAEHAVGRGDLGIIESYHNRAVQSGLESELTYYQRGGASVRVRAPGDTSISFLADTVSEEEIEEILAQERASAHDAQAFVYGKQGCSDQVRALIGELAETEEFVIAETPVTAAAAARRFGAETAFVITQPGIRRTTKIGKATKRALSEVDPAWEGYAEVL
jgi:hypothetical protein